MAKNFPVRKTKMNHSKKEVMISCTHFQITSGLRTWLRGKIALPVLRVQLQGSACILIHGQSTSPSLYSLSWLSTSPKRRPQKPDAYGSRTDGPESGLSARRNRTPLGRVQKHTPRLKSLLRWERGEPGETEKLSNQ